MADFTAFLEDLETRITDMAERKKALDDEVVEYEKLLGQLSEGFPSKHNLVNIGDDCYVQSKPLSEGIYVHVGYGFHLEMPIEQVKDFSRQRIEILQRKSQMTGEELMGIQADFEQAKEMVKMLQQVQD